MTDQQPPLSDISGGPRPVTRQAARRAWAEPRVRFWWLGALAVAVINLIFTINRVIESWHDHKLISSGTTVRTTIYSLNGGKNIGYTLFRDDKRTVELKGSLDGKEMIFKGELPPSEGALRVGSTMFIKVDPEHPDQWTDVMEATPWSRELVISIVLLGIIVILMMVTILRRRKVLRIWSEGIPAEGIVVGLSHSAVAPLSRMVHYSPTGGQSRRVRSTIFPPGITVPEKGEPLDLLVLREDPDQSIVTKLYQ